MRPARLAMIATLIHADMSGRLLRPPSLLCALAPTHSMRGAQGLGLSEDTNKCYTSWALHRGWDFDEA